ncbi:DUF1176 domain-containing protein [Mangrovibacter phragmitis]|uniref:DUF1176 domain-containing protein n=1 Tax=Mangrovibacter phragmitis TaxID=1691903 RepID=UPI00336ADAB5
MKGITPVGLLAMVFCSVPALAQDSGVSFSHKNWEVVCDNTLTCRAAGYSPEEGQGGSVLLTRKAGAGSAVTGKVMLAEVDEGESTPVAQLALWINGQPAGALTPTKNDDWQLSQQQTQRLVAAIKGSGKVEFKGGPEPFVLSGDGAYAVLLKMDDVQGRIGTPGALTKKGDKPESSVLAAIPAPVIQKVKTASAQPRPLTAPELKILKPQLLATLGGDDMCDNLSDSQEQGDSQMPGDNEVTLQPLDNSHSLISALCWRAAYNEGYGYWVIDKSLAGKPVLVTTSGSDYTDGEISESQKGRGIGDCWWNASWVWDGAAFRKSHEGGTGSCRYLRLGGTWDLPLWVAQVKPVQ